MTSKYIRMLDASPSYDHDHPISFRDARDVTVLDRSSVSTGILDQDGYTLYKLPNEIGFNRRLYE